MPPDYFGCGAHSLIIPRGIHKYFWDNLMNFTDHKMFLYVHIHTYRAYKSPVYVDFNQNSTTVIYSTYCHISRHMHDFHTYKFRTQCIIIVFVPCT